ncbi:CGNR zinc finger domain-containing protein [Streptomyces meridianus]|uniref:CGNR zinc finger domain-containing protein n=1 Tax=Streptomyces meridianus TaxID=2938945 RepID=A0ABT0X5M9_9ACTN|nr:CGNR zinc finger domain-containing protein [Streptomyces meridianus]MCM2577831.1 CGNR zinc finger domain-containing protein [Streptomyces meridianus]
MRQPGDRSPAPEALALVQDLANTVDVELADDGLRTVADLSAFCAAHGLGRLRFGADDVAPARRLREALRDVCRAHAGFDVPAESTAALDDLFGRAPLVLATGPAGEARPVPAPGLDGLPALTARLAAGVLTAVADGTWQRLKACSAPECRWVYYDRSPAGRSRWCTMSLCGSRAKMRAYRDRTRATGDRPRTGSG